MVTLGWRAAFYLAGGVGIFLALFCYWFATDGPAEHSWVNAAELRHITHGSAPSSVPSRSATPVPWRARLGRSDLWFVTAFYFMLGYIIYIYFSWFYLYLVNVRGFSELSGGWYSTAPFLAGALTSPLGGWVSDAVSRRWGKRAGRCGVGISGLLLTAGVVWGGAAGADPYPGLPLLCPGPGPFVSAAAAYLA